MNQKSRKSILKDLTAAVELYQNNEDKKLRDLSDHAVQDVVMYKSLDAVSVAVLIHALYKARQCVTGERNTLIITLLQKLITALKSKRYGTYNKLLEQIFSELKECVAINSSLKDVIYLAQIQKGASLFEQGVSAARAASIMGVSVWDLSPYIQKRQVHFKPIDKDHLQQKLTSLSELMSGDTVFSLDTGTIITLLTSRLIHVLDRIKTKHTVRFTITPYVYEELVNKPASIKKYQLESLEVKMLIEKGVLELQNVSKQRVNQAEKRADQIIEVDGQPIDLVQKAEVSCLVTGNPTLMDERTLRLICEDSEELLQVMTIRKRKAVGLNKNALQAFQAYVNCPPIFRSVELITWAIMNGHLSDYKLDNPTFAIESMLWSCKHNGAAVSNEEVLTLIQLASKHF